MENLYLADVNVIDDTIENNTEIINVVFSNDLNDEIKYREKCINEFLEKFGYTEKSIIFINAIKFTRNYLNRIPEVTKMTNELINDIEIFLKYKSKVLQSKEVQIEKPENIYFNVYSNGEIDFDNKVLKQIEFIWYLYYCFGITTKQLLRQYAEKFANKNFGSLYKQLLVAKAQGNEYNIINPKIVQCIEKTLEIESILKNK